MTLVPLDNVDHHDLTVAIRAGAAWGDAADRLPVFPSEFEDAQREFPILFRRDADAIRAVVLLGLRGANLFLAGDRWTTRYVPAVQRRGPFSMAPHDADGEMVIHVDLGDPRVGAPDGVPVFLPHGGDGPYLRHVTDALRVIDAGADEERAINGELDAAGLLRPVDAALEAAAGLMAIDVAALAALPAATLERLHRTGALRAAIMAGSSLGNVARLVEWQRHAG